MSASNLTKRKVSSNDAQASLQKKRVRQDKPEELTSSSASTNVSTNPSTTKSSAPVAVARKIDTTAKPTKNTAAFIVALPTVMVQVLAPMAIAIAFFLCLPLILGPERGGAILQRALSRAFRGGIPGFISGLVQIFCLMWLRTTMNYQFKTGASLCKALRTLWAEGGLGRFYRGLLPAILLVPLSRFGDSAANAGVLALFEMTGSSIIPVAAQTMVASAASAGWRVLLMPLIVFKTTLQVSGAKGLPALRERIRLHGSTGVFFKGTIGAMVAQFMGHYPWWSIHNFLEVWVPVQTDQAAILLRAAAIGCAATVVSDCITNGIRVVNCYRQTCNESLTYTETVRRIVKEDGVVGLLTRGLSTKMLANCLNAVIFKVLLIMPW